MKKFVLRIMRSSWKIKILVLLVLLAVLWFVYFKSDNKSEYTTDIVKRTNVTQMVSESGIIASVGSVAVYSSTNGLVDEVYVVNNQDVKKGQKLFSVSSTASKEERTVAYANYQVAASAVAQAENILRQTKATVDRVHDEVKDHDDDETFLQREKRTVAEVANDNAYDGLLAARAQLVSAQVAYQATQDAVVVAPVVGIISNLSITNGASVTVSNPLGGVSPALMVGSLGIPEVKILIGENNINKIEVDQGVVLKVDAIDNKNYKGVVSRVDEIGTVNAQGVVNFNIYIRITDPDDLLRVGMGVDAEIITEKLENVLSVPNSAIKKNEGKKAVRVPGEKGEVKYVDVEIGIKGTDRTQIINGLEEGQLIISSALSDSVRKTSPLGF